MAEARKIHGYTLREKIGQGKYGTVRIVTDETTGENFAMKIVNYDKISEKAKERLHRETELLATLEHPHIIGVRRIFRSEERVCIVMEHASYGDLFDYINSKQRLPLPEALRIFRQMVSALEYCHVHGVIHRDIKPENVFLDNDRNVKIGDFGFARKFKMGDPLGTPCGSISYAAPEIISGRKYFGPASDVWSCGVVLYVMLVGSLPFEGNNHAEIAKKINLGTFKPSKYLNDKTVKFLYEVLSPNPALRPSLREIAQHPALWQDKPLLAMLIKPFAATFAAKKPYHLRDRPASSIKHSSESTRSNNGLRRSISDYSSSKFKQHPGDNALTLL